MRRRERTAREILPPPERRHCLGTYFADRAKVAFGVFYFPDVNELRELRGRTVTTIATTSEESADEMIVNWLEECEYPETRRIALAQQLRRVHRNLKNYKACEG